MLLELGPWVEIFLPCDLQNGDQRIFHNLSTDPSVFISVYLHSELKYTPFVIVFNLNTVFLQLCDIFSIEIQLCDLIYLDFFILIILCSSDEDRKKDLCLFGQSIRIYRCWERIHEQSLDSEYLQ